MYVSLLGCNAAWTSIEYQSFGETLSSAPRLDNPDEQHRRLHRRENLKSRNSQFILRFQSLFFAVLYIFVKAMGDELLEPRMSIFFR